MTRTILMVASLAGALVLAGCGGSTNATGTGGGVAGAHHTQAAGSFRANVHGFEARLQSSVQAFQSGNLSKAASGAGLLTSCSSSVGKLGDEATTSGQKVAVSHLRIACSDMSKASNAGMSGNMTKAKQFARQALKQAQIAARLSG